MHNDTSKGTVQYNQINDTIFEKQIKTSILLKSQIQIKCSLKSYKDHINNKIKVRLRNC
jgi:hypothetical protein